MAKVRRPIFLSEHGKNNLSWEVIDEYMKMNNLVSRSEALSKMYVEYNAQKQLVSDRSWMATEFATILKKQLDPIRIRSGYVDKNVRVMIELLNSYILLHQLEEQFPMTEVLTKPIAEAREKISTEIKAYQVAMKDKKDKHQTQGVADE